MSQENHEDDILDVQESVTRLYEKYRSILKKSADLEREVRQTSDFRVNAEVRLKMVESDMDRVSKELSEMDRRLRIFELNHDNRKERWNMVVNFVIQLAWVSMAAFLLTKLGLQAPL